VKAEVVSAHKGGMWAWLFQRITAVLLIVCLAIHLLFTHILNIGELDYENVANRLAHGTLTAVSIMKSKVSPPLPHCAVDMMMMWAPR